MGISLTIFDNVFDNTTIKRMDYDSFEHFESVLVRLSKATKYSTKKQCREDYVCQLDPST